MNLLHLAFWLGDLIWLIALVFGYRAAPSAGWPAVASWAPWICVTVLGVIVLGLHVTV